MTSNSASPAASAGSSGGGAARHGVAGLRGNIVLLMTPFDADEKLDLASYQNLLRFVMSGGVDGLILLGTAGEFFSLTTEEKIQLIDLTVAEVGDELPVCVGVGHSGTGIAADLARYAAAHGAAAVLIPPPYYYPSSEAGMVRHFTAVASAVSVPVMIYDGGGGISVPLAVLDQVTRACPNVTLIKASVLDVAKFSSMRRQLGDRVSILCGDEVMLLPELASGAVGMATAAGNVLPKQSTEVCQLFLAGQREEARALYDKCLAPWTIASGIAKHEFIRCFKEVLAEMGVIASATTRLPLAGLHPSRRDEVIAVARRVGIL
jgi:4-hydroxy-tetrahydrodipicolinate synthase